MVLSFVKTTLPMPGMVLVIFFFVPKVNLLCRINNKIAVFYPLKNTGMK